MHWWPTLASPQRFHLTINANFFWFSLQNSYFALTHGRQVHVWRMPGPERKFMQLSRFREFTGHHQDVTTLDWSFDSR